MKQTKYDFATPNGLPGGLVDLTGYVCDSYTVEAENGVLKFGTAVTTGTAAEKVTALAPGATIAQVEGILLNGLITEHTMDGDVRVLKGKTVGVIKQGRVWARCAEKADPKYGDAVYISLTAGEIGYVTTADAKEDGAIKINAKFLGGKGTEGAAPIELYPNVYATLE